MDPVHLNPMNSRADRLMENAAECGRMATIVSDRSIKAIYSNLAMQWREMALRAEMLESRAAKAMKAIQSIQSRTGKATSAPTVTLNRTTLREAVGPRRFRMAKSIDPARACEYIFPHSNSALF